MTGYIVARLLAVIPTVLVLVFFVVVLIRLLPGNAVDVLLAEQGGANSEEQRAQLEARLGLDKSLPEDYVAYSFNLFQGDLGTSLWSDDSVRSILVKKLPVTMELGLYSLLVGTTFGLFVGVISAVKQNSPIDFILRTIAITGLSVPNFAIATLIVVMPVIWWGWSPPLIYTPISESVTGHIGQFIAPALILGLGLSASLMRITRTMMLEVLRQDYVRTARAKGLRDRVVVMRHAIRNALIPVVSLMGLQLGIVVSGTVILEQIFGLPGMGRELISSVNVRDYPVVQGMAVITGLFIILVNLGVDLSYGLLDPRVSIGRSAES